MQHGVGGFGESVWGGAFEDESFALTHDARGKHTLRVRAQPCYVHTHAAHTLCAHSTLTMSMYSLHTYYGEGVLSMANTGKDTNRAQFFLLFGPQVIVSIAIVSRAKA